MRQKPEAKVPYPMERREDRSHRLPYTQVKWILYYIVATATVQYM
jgi:hypothetical protein